jgi:hypothetical protein
LRDRLTASSAWTFSGGARTYKSLATAGRPVSGVDAGEAGGLQRRDQGLVKVPADSAACWEHGAFVHADHQPSTSVQHPL